MKKINNCSLMIVLIVLIITSCKENFFEHFPPGQISDNTLEGAKGAETVLTGAYSALSGFQVSAFNSMEIGTDNRLFGSIAADDGYAGSHIGDRPKVWTHELYQVLPTNVCEEYRWKYVYDGVSRANDALKLINEAENNGELSAEKAKKMKAEARFIRGWLHYNQKIVFKYIPYITLNLENPVSDMPYTKAEMENPSKVPNMTSEDNEIDTWRLIEGDIKYAVDNLPEKQEEIGRVDKYAAEVLLARVFLMQGKYAEVKPLLIDIIENSGAELVEHFYWNYDIVHNNNKESLFEIQSFTNSNGIATQNSFNTGLGVMPRKLGGWGLYQISLQTVNAFQVNEQGLPLENWDKHPFKHSYGILSTEEFHPSEELVDPRLDWTVGRRGIPFLGWGIHIGSGYVRDPAFGGVFNSKKHMFSFEENGKERPSTMYSGSSTQNIRKFRLGHVYLWMAEVETNEGNFESARWYINKLRERASNHVVMGKCYSYEFNDDLDPNVNWDEPAANYKIGLYRTEDFNTKDKAWRAIQIETFLETAAEGLRFFDLRRWEEHGNFNFSMVEWMNNYIENDWKQYRPFLKEAQAFFDEEDKYFPIPQRAVDDQPGIIKQNPNFR
ncbi:RagB/SusD family nutrient uptake outer membrane protein [Mariniphaga sediminis]|nr:RagB/SusD family nutrient uptake outer membrane protein [Mariniphaga sediminis]